MKQEKLPKLSIIVPIYNVEQYLETCLSSIERQTYPDFEVIMVDDGSTDTSAEICKRWEQHDKRFHYIYQKNQGLGPARNTGIRVSRSGRILFIDSDDWVHHTIVEKLLSKSLETDADITYGDFCAIYPDGSERAEPIRSLFQLVNATSQERIDYSFQRSVWGAVYKKDIWIKNDLFMPDIVYEDTAVYGLLLCYAKKIEAVSEVLYYYRAGRPGSLMEQGRKDYKNMLNALDCFLKKAVELGLFEQYINNFFRYCNRQLGRDFRNCERKMEPAGLAQVKADMETLLNTYFPIWRSYKASGFMAIGSYTSCEVYNRLTLFRDRFKDNYAFTTLESLMSGELNDNDFQFLSDNAYRIEMVKKDLHKTWRKNLDTCNYIILDLLEERHNIFEFKECYFTGSEAFDEVCQFNSDYHRILSGKDKNRRILWEKSCNAFFETLKHRKKQIFVLELYLCENMGIRGKEKPFEHIDAVRAVNAELSYFYDYIRNNFPYAHMIRIREEAFFTEINYPFGCKPWHYNEIALFELSEQIADFLISEPSKAPQQNEF